MKNNKFYLQQIRNPLTVKKMKNDVIKWCHDFTAIFPLTMFILLVVVSRTAQKMKFSMKDFFSKYNQIRRKLRVQVSFQYHI